MCERRRRRQQGGGGPRAGRWVSQLAERLPRSSRVARLHACCRLRGSSQPRLPRPHSGRLALAEPDAPAQPQKVEGGAALSASAAPLRPRVFPAPTRGAAPHSGGGGDSAGHSRVPGDGPTAGRERGPGVGLRIVAGTGGTNGSVSEWEE